MDENLCTGAASEVVMTMRIERGEPISGTLTLHGRAGEQRFCGWMELIAAITAGHQSWIEPDELLPDGTRA
jgi:hypothetical protein